MSNPFSENRRRIQRAAEKQQFLIPVSGSDFDIYEAKARDGELKSVTIKNVPYSKNLYGLSCLSSEW